MKKFVINTIITLITITAFKAAAFDSGVITGPLDVQLTLLTQTGDFTSKTNSTATSTNITERGKSIVKKTPFKGADLLALMENSFNTNFPLGSQVGLVLQGSIVVVDASGTNIVFFPSNSLVAFGGIFPSVQATTQVTTTVIDSSGTNQSGSGSNVGTSVGSLIYDDTAVTTMDGTHSKFTVSGKYVQTNVRGKGKDFVLISGQFEGVGSGTVRDKFAFIEGTFRLKPFHATPAD
jgi:hypothetical protein